jgi:hypothetical protein
LKESDAVASGVCEVDIDARPIRAVRIPFQGRLSPNELALFGLGINCCNAVVRKEIVQRAGGFRENLHQGEDIDFFMRVAMLGNLSLLKEQTVLRRVHEGHFTADHQQAHDIRFQDGLKAMLLQNCRRLNYPLSTRIAGYLHLYLAWSGARADKRAYAWRRLKEAVRQYPLLLMEPMSSCVIARILLLANARLHGLLRKTKGQCKNLASASS